MFWFVLIFPYESLFLPSVLFLRIVRYSMLDYFLITNMWNKVSKQTWLHNFERDERRNKRLKFIFYLKGKTRVVAVFVYIHRNGSDSANHCAMRWSCSCTPIHSNDLGRRARRNKCTYVVLERRISRFIFLQIIVYNVWSCRCLF